MIVSDLPSYLADLRESLDLAREAAQCIATEIREDGGAAAPDDLDDLRAMVGSAESVIAHVRTAIYAVERSR